MPRSTGYRVFSKCDEIKKDLVNKKGNVKWSSVSKRSKRYPLINDSLKILIQNWIINHPSIVASPIAKDTVSSCWKKTCQVIKKKDFDS